MLVSEMNVDPCDERCPASHDTLSFDSAVTRTTLPSSIWA